MSVVLGLSQTISVNYSAVAKFACLIGHHLLECPLVMKIALCLALGINPRDWGWVRQALPARDEGSTRTYPGPLLNHPDQWRRETTGRGLEGCFQPGLPGTWRSRWTCARLVKFFAVVYQVSSGFLGSQEFSDLWNVWNLSKTCLGVQDCKGGMTG